MVTPKLTPKDNLMAALSHRTPDWIPWVPYVGGVNTPCFVPEDMKQAQDFVEIGLFMQDKLGCDVLISGQALKRSYHEARLHDHTAGDLYVQEYEIAGRTLQRSSRSFRYGDQPSRAICRYPVRTLEDMEALSWLVQDEVVEPDASDYEDMTRRLGERGVVYVNGPRTPIMTLIIDYMGLEAFLWALVDHTTEMEQLMATMHQTSLAAYHALAQTPCEVIGTFDDFDTSLISPAMYRKYVLPYLREYTEICRQAGKIHMVHACGHVRAFLPMCLEVGYDAHNYLTPPPTGDTPLAEARAIWGDRITMMAPVDPVRLEMASPEEISDRTIQILEQAPGLAAFVLMTSSKPTVPEENLRAVAAVMREHKQRSLVREEVHA